MSKKTKITLFVLSLLTVLLVALIALSISPNRDFSAVYKIVGTPFSIAQEGIKKVSTRVSSWFNYIFSYDEVQNELETLRDINSEIPLLEDENDRLRLENDNLRNLIDIEPRQDEYETLAATIIAEDVTDWFNTFTIDRGSEDGVKVGNSVITPDGLVGLVIEVGVTSSKLLTIVDEDYAFMCRVSRTNELVRVKGGSRETLNYDLEIDRLTKTSTLMVGDKIVTAKSGGVFPEGLMVGTVKEVNVDKNDGTITAVLTTAVDLTLLSHVYVLLEAENEVP